jgi:hypothetical protein
MTVSITDGILGLEARHNWVYGTLTGTLNDLSTTPRSRLTSIRGLHSLPDADDNRAPYVGRPGEQIYPSHERGRTIVYEGVIEARSLSELRSAGRAQRKAFRRRYSEGTMTATPHPAWGTVSHWYAARVTDYQSDDEQSRSPHSAYPYSRDFTLTLRQSDPRYYVTGLNSQSAANNVQVFCNNVGDAPSDPVIEIQGPIDYTDTITITRGDGIHLTFTHAIISTGDILVVDFKRRYVYEPASDTDYTGGLVISSSNWWD